MKKLFTLLFVLAVSAGCSLNSWSSAMIEVIELSDDVVRITIKGSVLHVMGASDKMLDIYNITGVKVKSIRVDGDDRQYSLNLPKGCYIVKVGSVVRKISVS